eukprot:6181109-Pleurochrysis_carterae.AAC.1
MRRGAVCLERDRTRSHPLVIDAAQGSRQRLARDSKGPWPLGVADDSIIFEICLLRLRVKPVLSSEGIGLECESEDCSLPAALLAPQYAQRAWRAQPHAPADALSRRVEGSGPYHGNVQGELFLLRAGVLIASGRHSALRYWRPLSASLVALSKKSCAPLGESQLA